ncbi:putative clathrin assembly protein At5g57200 [Mangifera indica]|uniref:putative clathrin assembly protein At5g57200 n=1 Tax=Mangifera indica TaxID=29780 RepID=UPI001CFC008C|nr:putative clathrin assembly protein At5g57200 [Mangifera indica]
MAASSHQSLRKAIGAIKDSTKVGLVSCLNSENKDVDVAIVKATTHDEALPKEKHIKTILDAVSASRPRADVAYCIQGLSKRLTKTHSWMVALKTLIVVHRALREVDTSFCQEVINFSRRGLMLNLSHFRDESSPTAWDYSAWVRKYALYLEERVECFRLLKYDVEKSQLQKTKGLQTADLLEQLPFLQQLLFRLLGCKPEGVAMHNGLIHYALSIVLRESIKIYVTITDGILSLVDKFFEMQCHDAVRALEIYRKSGSQAESLNELYEICRGLGFVKEEYKKIEQPPPSFLASMEEYVQQAPHSIALESAEGVPVIEARKVVADAPESDTNITEADQSVSPEPRSDQGGANLLDLDVGKSTTTPELRSNHIELAAKHQIFDLLGLDEQNPEASQLEERKTSPGD